MFITMSANVQGLGEGRLIKRHFRPTASRVALAKREPQYKYIFI